jgi:hypothetical protein
VELAVRALVGFLDLDDAVHFVEAGDVAFGDARRVADESDDGLLAAEDRVGLDAVLAFEQFAQRVDLVARRAVFEYEDHGFVSFRSKNAERRLGFRPGAVPFARVPRSRRSC